MPNCNVAELDIVIPNSRSKIDIASEPAYKAVTCRTVLSDMSEQLFQH